MVLHPNELETEVGVRELHDHLSRYVRQVQGGTEIVGTMRGRRVARLVPVDERGPLADLRDRGLVREPASPRKRSRRSHIASTEPVSDLGAEQRR